MSQPPLSVLVSGSATQRPTRWLSVTVAALAGLTLACGAYVAVGARRPSTMTALLLVVLTLSTLAGAGLDRSERRRRIARYDSDVARVFDGLPLGLALIRSAGGTRGLIGYANAHFAAMAGRPAADLLGVDLVSLAHPEDQIEVLTRLGQALDGRPERTGGDVRFVCADGSLRWVTLSYGLLHTSFGEPIAVAQITDNTLRKEAESVLLRRAYHDPLTDLPNRYLMGEHLTRILVRARRTDAGVGVLFIDLDDFKEVNDRFGHDTGDRLLIEVADRLRGCLRASDLAARLGGDEFVVVCEDVASRDDLDAVADRIRRAITFTHRVDDRSVSTRASVGAVMANRDEDVEQVLARADAVMYAEKVRSTAPAPSGYEPAAGPVAPVASSGPITAGAAEAPLIDLTPAVTTAEPTPDPGRPSSTEVGARRRGPAT